MSNRRFGALSSSEDPQKLGDTVKGIIIGATVLIIYLAGLLGFEIGGEQIANAAVIIGGAVSSVWTLYGLIKKIVVAVSARFSA